MDATLTARVAAALGVDPPAPTGGGIEEVAMVSPAPSQLPHAPGRIDGRVVAILAGDDVDALVMFDVDVDAPGVIKGSEPDDDFTAALVEALGWHRFWERQPALVTA